MKNGQYFAVAYFSGPPCVCWEPSSTQVNRPMIDGASRHFVIKRPINRQIGVLIDNNEAN